MAIVGVGAPLPPSEPLLWTLRSCGSSQRLLSGLYAHLDGLAYVRRPPSQ